MAAINPSQDLDVLSDLFLYEANLAVQALLWFNRQAHGRRGRISGSDVDPVRAAEELGDLIRFCCRFPLDPIKLSPLASNPVVAAMFHTLRLGDDDHEAFWRAVAAGMVRFRIDTVGVNDQTPATRLGEFLSRVEEKSWAADMRQHFADGQAPSEVEVFGTCMRLYAAHRNGATRVRTVEKLRDIDVEDIVKNTSRKRRTRA